MIRLLKIITYKYDNHIEQYKHFMIYKDTFKNFKQRKIKKVKEYMCSNDKCITFIDKSTKNNSGFITITTYIFDTDTLTL